MTEPLPAKENRSADQQNTLIIKYMKMHKLSLIAALALGSLLACTNPTSAQDTNAVKEGGRGMMSVEARLERLSKELNLTDDRKPKVKAMWKKSPRRCRTCARYQPDAGTTA